MLIYSETRVDHRPRTRDTFANYGGSLNDSRCTLGDARNLPWWQKGRTEKNVNLLFSTAASRFFALLPARPFWPYFSWFMTLGNAGPTFSRPVSLWNGPKVPANFVIHRFVAAARNSLTSDNRLRYRRQRFPSLTISPCRPVGRSFFFNDNPAYWISPHLSLLPPTPVLFTRHSVPEIYRSPTDIISGYRVRLRCITSYMDSFSLHSIFSSLGSW